MNIQIKHRHTATILWQGEAENVRDAITKAVAARADLADANLAGANLADANLADANLAGANLADANLADANLADAYLAGANLARANLAGAYLRDAYLAGAYLADAYLADAYLAGANLARAYLAGAYLAGANLRDAYLAGAYLAGARNLSVSGHTDPKEPYVRKSGKGRLEYAREYREKNPDVPVIEKLDAKILEAISLPGNALDMSNWHSCETTHCRAGWAIHLAGKAGYELEKKLGDPARAGRAIYRASTGRSPWFYDPSTECALEDIKRCAAEDEAGT